MASFSVKFSIYFVFNIAVVYILGMFIRKENKSKKSLLQLTLLWLIGGLCFFKYTKLFLNTASILLPVGLSYITFRLIHYIVEVYRKNITVTSFTDFALYILFFPTFLAGPVERFERFYPQAVKTKGLNFSEINYGLFRIICGLIRKAVIADNLARLVTPVLHSPQLYTQLMVVLSVYGLAIQIYMDFAGYTDIAIGISRLFGYEIIENFNRPYFKKNIALFWRSWHISVYSWIRDYFFFPVFGYKTSKAKIYAGIIITMLVFHLWHGASLNFIILGLYHGLGLAAWHIFQEVKKKAPKLKEVIEHKYLDPISTFFTFSFVSFGTVFLMMDYKSSMHIFLRLIK